jgi:ATP-dependent Clp protease protease subunit
MSSISKNNNTIFTTFKKCKNIIDDVQNIVNMPKIITVNKFNEESAKQFISDFYEAENSNQEIIPILIDSYGGQVYSLLSMIDCIKSSKKKIATISIGKSMSCGSILLSCGTEGYRYISPTSTVMIHDVSLGTHGKIEEVKADAKEGERLYNLVFNIMDKNCGHEDGYFQKLIHKKGHADWYLNPEEVVSHNLANHIRIPKFEISVSANIKFC